ncbi:integral membrane protein, putative [Eimeria necatrix]|uniref:Integral membrane protein, putative n=1 Tax=Eimeria necatrix TaxID=51315 RepID=U6MMQ6_9EIME|nr:integral membrane protein, putative [Eimeria necatrix]CDJ65301.1 integral membrane protein, putative [Eimeria necatrix]
MEKAPGLNMPFVDTEDINIGAHKKPHRLGSGEWDTVAGEDESLIEKAASPALKPVPFATRVVSSLIAMLQGVEVLCNLAILYLFKDDFKIDPALLAVVLGALRLPWTVKPLWAVMADNFPLFGYRRKSYIFIGASMCIVATLGIGLGGYRSLAATTSLLLLYFWGSAVCNVIGEALVVEAGRRDASEEATARTVSMFFAFRKISFATVSYLSGVLLAIMAKQYVFVIAAALPAAVVMANFWLEEPQAKVLPVKEQFKELARVLKQPTLLNSTLFIFIMMATPSAGSIMFYFMTNELHFGPELLGRMALFQSIASLIGILVYMYFCSTTSIRKLLLVSTVAITPFCLLPVVVIERWNVSMGIPDSVFVVTDTVLMEFAGEFQAMPILVLAARLCPPGLESTIYSVLLSAYNLGLGLGSLVSAGLTAALGISSTNFKGLSALTVICALSNLLPLCLIWMIPAKVEGPSLLLPSKHVPRRLPQKTDDGASTTADSDGGAAETSANNSDMEAGSVWRANIGSGLTRRGTVQVVDGGPEERYSPVSSHDSFAALGSVGGMLSGCRSPSEEIFESGGSGECAVSPQPRW